MCVKRGLTSEPQIIAQSWFQQTSVKASSIPAHLACTAGDSLPGSSTVAAGWQTSLPGCSHVVQCGQ